MCVGVRASSSGRLWDTIHEGVTLSASWIAVGLTLGAYLNWLIVAPRLRACTEVSRNSITVPSFFENRLRDRSRLLRIVSSVIILVFFTLCISSGMVAGGVFFESSFDGVQYEITYSQSALTSWRKLDRVIAQRMVLAIGHRREVYR